MKKKKCTTCGKIKPINEFIKHKGCIDGYAGTCRMCANTYSTNWKRKNSVRLAKKRRERYAKNNGERVRQREIKRKLEHPIRVRAQVLRMGMVTRSKKKNLDFDSDYFSVTYLMQLLKDKPFCECCGKHLDTGFKNDNKPHDDSPSMDRINSSLGYTKENTALLCWRCNNLKRDATTQELDTILKWMRLKGLEIDP